MANPPLKFIAPHGRKETVMEKVTYSVAMAIKFMLDLTWHGDSSVRRNCPALMPVYWGNFLFFRRIVPRAIRRIERVQQTNTSIGYWIVERNVDFYLKDQLIGVVTLRGMKYDRQQRRVDDIQKAGLDVEDVLSSWAVSHVWYFRIVGVDKIDRIETDVPYSSFSSGRI